MLIRNRNYINSYSICNNQLLTPTCQTVSQYPDFKKYITEVRSLSNC
ncbi:hypothetical protein [Bacillus mycoides]